MSWVKSPYANAAQLQRVIRKTWNASNYAVTREKIQHLIARHSNYYGDCSALFKVLSYTCAPLVYDASNNKITDAYNLNLWYNQYADTVRKFSIQPHNIYNVSSKELPFTDPKWVPDPQYADRYSSSTTAQDHVALATLVECVSADAYESNLARNNYNAYKEHDELNEGEYEYDRAGDEQDGRHGGDKPTRFPASNQAMPPFFLFRGTSGIFRTWMDTTLKNLQPDIRRPDMFYYHPSVSWFWDKPASHWFHLFNKWSAPRCNYYRDYRLLLVDSTLGRIDSDLNEIATAHRILIMYAPPWSRLYPLQPLDSCFSTVSVSDLAPLTYPKSFNSSSYPQDFYSSLISITEKVRKNIPLAWQVTGLHPYDPNRLLHLCK